jgi:hypothetical protein
VTPLRYDLSGKQFGKLRVIEFRSNHGWLCECACTSLAYYQSSHLRDGRTTSCGCARLSDRRPLFNGAIIDADGYAWVWAPDHLKNHHGRIRGHILVMEEHMGRPLTDDEEVHHKNRLRHDNRLENLELWSHSHPKTARVEDLLTWAREILTLYEKT